MNKETSRYIRLGIFTIVALIGFTVAIYLIGDKQDLFSATFPLKARFTNVNGLKGGNNVRFAGIDIGTIKGVNIIADTVVEVRMEVKEEVRRYINANALASVGTDGLMGNKLVTIINPTDQKDKSSKYVADNATLNSKAETDIWAMVEEFSVTNKNLQSISGELLTMVKDMNSGKGSIGQLLKDDKMADNLNKTVLSFKSTGDEVSKMMKDINKVVSRIEKGEGIGGLLADTTMITSIKSTLAKLDETGQQATEITREINTLVKQVNSGGGPASTLLKDDGVSSKIQSTVKNIEGGTRQINELLEAAKHNFLFRGYFKKKAKGKIK